MKTRPVFLLAALLVLLGHASPVSAQGTVLTYQGRLNDAAGPASGTYDFQFTVRDALTGGVAVGVNPLAVTLAVSNGLFTATLDPGAGVFTGADRWLEIAVKTNGAALFTTLSPRQKFTTAPYAITAGNLNGALPSANLSGTYANAVTLNNGANSFSGNGAGLTNLNASQLASGTVPAAALSNAWRIGGNAGATPGAHFIGTTDTNALEFKVNNQRGLRLEPTGSNDTVNVIGGSSRNFVGAGVVAATIGGGGAGDYFGFAYTNRVEADFGTVSGGLQNTIQTDARLATIGGGFQNTIQRYASSATIGGGYINTIQTNAIDATIGGGIQNTIQTNATDATIGGGNANTIQTNAGSATIGGGRQNTIQPNAFSATIPGGRLNSATNYAFAAGNRAKANHTGAFVWGDATDADFASTANNQFLIRAAGNVGINKTNPATALDVNGTVTATSFSGNGASLTSLDAGSLTGSVPGATLLMTPFPAGNLSGTIVDARLSANVALLNANQNFAASNNFTGALVATNGNNRFTGNGAGLTNLSAANLVSGTLADARLSANVALLNANQTFSGSVIATSFSGNGAGLASLNASQLTSGTVPDARLNPNVSLLGASIESAEITDGTIAPADMNLTAFNTTFWKPTGNAGANPTNGAFLGTTDNQPLEFKVNNQRGLRLEPGGGNSVNVIGGWFGNGVAPGVVGATVAGGGASNYFGGPYTNRVEADFGSVSGGAKNTIQPSAYDATIGGGFRNTIQLGGSYGTIGGGEGNTIQTNASRATISGGYVNTIEASADYGAAYGTIGGGYLNVIQTGADASTIGGGGRNTIPTNALYATIPGGQFNSATNYAFAAGFRAKANHTGTFVWADSKDEDFASTANDEFSIRARGGVRLSGDTPNLSFGSQTRQMLSLWGTQYGIGVQSDTLYFRCDNSANGGFMWYKKGIHDNGYANPGGGKEMMHLIDDRLSVQGSMVVDQAGLNNGLISSASLTFGTSSGEGIASKRTLGVNRFGLDFYTGSTNRMAILNNGNVGIGTLVPTSTLTVIGNIQTSGNIFASGSICASNGVNCVSDRNVKDGFEPVDTKAILEKVAALAITRWHYTNDPATPHLGAMAQDFHAAFAVGPDDKHIATVDADGVALAAIQGLNQKVKGEVTTLRAENAELKQRLEKLEQLMNRQDGGGR